MARQSISSVVERQQANTSRLTLQLLMRAQYVEQFLPKVTVFQQDISVFSDNAWKISISFKNDLERK